MKGLEYLIKLNDKLSATADKIVGKAKTLGSSLSGLNDKITKLDKTSRISGGLQNFGNKLSSIIPSANAVKGALVGAAIGLGIYANSVVDTSLKIDNAERVIKFASGAEGARNIAFLNQEIQDLNLPLVQTFESFAKVTGSFKDTVLAGQPMREIFDGVSTAVSGMNLSADTSEGVFLALGQIMSKGKVSAEELTGQLGERLPGALTIAARSMNMTTGQLMEMMANGELLATTFLPRFAAELKRTFQGAALEAKNSAQGIFNAYQNAMVKLKEELGKSLLPILTDLAQKVTPLIQEAAPYIRAFIAEAGVYFQKVSVYFGEIFDALMNLVNQMTPYKAMFEDMWNSIGDIFITLKTRIVDIIGMFAQWDWETIIQQLALGFRLVADILAKLWVILKPIASVLIAIAGWIVKRLLLAINDALKFIDTLLGAVGKAISYVQDLLTNLGFLDKTKTEIEVVQKVKKLAPGQLNDSGFLNMGGNASGKPQGFGGMPPSTTDKANKTGKEITGGGSRPVNIHITLDSLIKGGFTVNTTTVKEGAATMRDIIEDELLKILNGANQLAGA